MPFMMKVALEHGFHLSCVPISNNKYTCEPQNSISEVKVYISSGNSDSITSRRDRLQTFNVSRNNILDSNGKRDNANKILAKENDLKRKSSEMIVLDEEISEHLRLVSYHSSILRTKMAERSVMMLQSCGVVDNPPVIIPEKVKIDNKRTSPCRLCGVKDVLKRKRSDHICSRCRLSNKSYTRKAKNNFQISKTTRNDFLTNREMKVKLVSLNKEKILQKQRVKNLLNKVKNCERILFDRMGNENVLRLLRQSLDCYKKNEASFKKDIVSELLVISEETSVEKSKEIEEFAEEIVMQINNMAQQLEGKSSQVRFSPRIMRIALSTWQRSTSAYNNLLKSKLMILPSIRELQKLKGANKIDEGFNTNTYTNFLDEISHKPKKHQKLRGHLVVDEMKLKGGVYMRTSDNKIIAFSNSYDAFRLKGEIAALIKDGKGLADIINQNLDQDNTLHHANYVNQWKFRSVYGETRNLEFFFNDGTLDGNEMLRQFLHIIMCLDVIGVEVYGLCLDGGGSNRGFVSRILSNAKFFSNPFSTTKSRPLFVWYCMTHMQKNMRNQLLTSDFAKQSARQFYDIYDNPFCWKTVIEQWRRNETRVSNNLFPITDLVMGSVYPDCWNKMSVKLSKSISSLRTLSEGFYHFSNELGCLNQIKSGDERVKDVRMFNVQRCHILNHLANTSSNVSLHVKSGVADMTYRAHVGCIFNETFMNRHRKLVHYNYNEEKQKIKKFLNYFKYWDEYKHKRQKMTDVWGDKAWEKVV